MPCLFNSHSKPRVKTTSCGFTGRLCGYVPDYFLAGCSNFLESLPLAQNSLVKPQLVILTSLLFNRLKKDDITCNLMRFRGAGVRLAVSVPILYAKLAVIRYRYDRCDSLRI